MEAVFLTLLEVSAASAMVILVVVLLSSIINRSFTAKWKYWLWMVLAIRLLIPVNPSFEAAPARVEVSIPAASIAIPASIAAQPAQPVTPPQLPADGKLPLPNTPAAPVSPAPAAVTVPQLLMLVWLCGAVLFLLWQAVNYLRFLRRVRRWSLPLKQDGAAADIRRQVKAELGIRGKVPALVCQRISSPMMIGFFRPLLLLPREDYGEQDLRYILRHELTHWRRRDIWYKALLLLANAVHWFNPAVWLMVREASRDLEISCDAAVMKDAGMEERREYSETILACVRRQPGGMTALSTHFYGGKRALKERFTNILTTKKRRTGLAAFGLVFLCGVLVGGLVVFGAAAPESDGPGDAGLSADDPVSSGLPQDETPEEEPLRFPDFYGVVATGYDDSEFAPGPDRMPTQSDWAGPEQVEEYQALLDSLDPGQITNFVFFLSPSSESQSVVLQRDTADVFFQLLKSLRLTVSPRVNPATGGAVTLHILTDDDQLVIQHLGNLLYIGRRGQDTVWTFEGESCADLFRNMRTAAEEMLSNADRLNASDRYPLYFGFGPDGENAQAMNAGDRLGEWTLENYAARWPDGPDGFPQVVSAHFSADQPVELNCSVTLAPYVNDRRVYWVQVSLEDQEKMPIMPGAFGGWFQLLDDPVSAPFRELGPDDQLDCRVGLRSFTFSTQPEESMSLGNVDWIEVGSGNDAVRTVAYNASLLSFEGNSVGSYFEYAIQMPAAWTVSNGLIYDEEGLLTAEPLPWLWDTDGSGFDRLAQRYPDVEPAAVRFGELEGMRYYERTYETDAPFQGAINNELYYYVKRYDYLIGLKFYPHRGIGIGTQSEELQRNIRFNY